MNELTYQRLLLPRLRRSQDRPGFVVDGSIRTFGEHFDRVERICRWWATDLELDGSDAVAVIARNSVTHLELWHAAYLGAATIVPVNWRLAPGEMVHVLADCGAKAVFADADFWPQVTGGQIGLDLNGRCFRFDSTGTFFDSSATAIELPSVGWLPPEPDESDRVAIYYTGGTTGHPKGVVHTQRSQTLGFYRMYMSDSYRDDDVVLSMTPMFHRAGVVGSLLGPPVGATSIMVARPDPAELLSVIETHQVTRAMFVPTVLERLLWHPEFDPQRLASLRRISYGGSPMPTPVLELLRDRLPDVELTQNYGMTESGSPVTVLDGADHRAGGQHLGSVGRPIAGIDIQVWDKGGNLCEDGVVGEIVIRSGSVMQGYLNKPEATARVLDRGWYHSGDAGYFDPDGYLYVVDRVDDMIVTGGENVYSLEVERALLSCAGIAAVSVYGVPDPTWGKRVHADIVVDGRAVSEGALRSELRGRIAGYKIPRTFAFVDSIPLSGALKPIKVRHDR